MIVCVAAGANIVSLTLSMSPFDGGGGRPPPPMQHHWQKAKTKKMMERSMVATERTLRGSSQDDNEAERILRRKLARIICSMRLMLTHAHHGTVVVAELPSSWKARLLADHSSSAGGATTCSHALMAGRLVKREATSQSRCQY